MLIRSGEFPDAETLWTKYIATDAQRTGIPVVFRGAAKDWPAMTQFSDDYMLKKCTGGKFANLSLHVLPSKICQDV